MTPTASPTAGRIDGIDLLHGLAIFFVLMNHVNIRLLIAKVPYTNGLPDQLVSSLVWNGQLGVQIFFAVSGFLITTTAIRRWGSALPRQRAWLLPHAVRSYRSIALAAVDRAQHPRSRAIQRLRRLVENGRPRLALFPALTFHVNVLEAKRGYLPGNWDILWSLSVEEVFYFFFPLVARLFGRGKMLVVLLLGFVALGPFARTVLTHGNEIWKEYSYLGGMDAIALGCLTALLVARFHFSRLILWILGSLGTSLLIFCVVFSLRAEAWGLDRVGVGMTIVALGTCMIAAMAAQTNWKSARALYPFLSLGQRSYEVYLTHMFVVFALFHLFVLARKPMAAVLPLFIVVVVVAGLLGEVVARFYSEPLNRFIRDRWGNRPSSVGSLAEAGTAIPREARAER